MSGRVCGCGCRRSLEGRRANAVYFDGACRVRACRERKRQEHRTMHRGRCNAWNAPRGAQGGRVSDRTRAEVIRSNPNLRLLALPREEAATVVGMSAKKFDEVVRPYVRAIRRGGLLLFPVADLERWADENAELVDVAA